MLVRIFVNATPRTWPELINVSMSIIGVAVAAVASLLLTLNGRCLASADQIYSSKQSTFSLKSIE